MPAATARLIAGVAQVTLVLALASSCASGAASTEITRDRAIAIARAQVTWQPFDVSATRTSSNGRPVWKVTLKGRLPDQPPMLFETTIVEIDAGSGAIVSVAKT